MLYLRDKPIFNTRTYYIRLTSAINACFKTLGLTLIVLVYIPAFYECANLPYRLEFQGKIVILASYHYINYNN